MSLKKVIKKVNAIEFSLKKVNDKKKVLKKSIHSKKY